MTDRASSEGSQPRKEPTARNELLRLEADAAMAQRAMIALGQAARRDPELQSNPFWVALEDAARARERLCVRLVMLHHTKRGPK